MKTITVTDIADKPRTKFGKVFPAEVRVGHHAEVTPGEKIVLYGTVRNRYDIPDGTPYRKEFKVGDLAEYHSYNCHYVGPIEAIGAKTVTIRGEGCHSRRLYRLSLYDFSRRNYLLDLAKIEARNEDVLAHC